jgi:N-carbamoylputrescine amidase
MSDRQSIHVGIVQYACSNQASENLERAKQFIHQAASKGAELVCLPELFHTPYFCQSIDAENFDRALALESAAIKELRELAADHKLVTIVPFFERRTAGIYHNSLVIIEQDGSIAGIYRKTHLPDDPGFYEKYYFTPGENPIEPIQTSVGKIGALICWDQWFPEAARLMALRGADLLVYPTAIGTLSEETPEQKSQYLDAWQTIQRSHAIANALPVISVNRVGREGDISFWGRSFVTGALGEYLVKADQSDGVWAVKVDLTQTEKQRQIWPFMRDRRIDLYSDMDKRYLED